MNDLTEKLLASKKYRDVCPDTVRRVVGECIGKYKKEKDAEKAVREHLHGITSAFMTESEYKRALDAAREDDLEVLLNCHASTRERMPLEAMDALYARIFAHTGMPETVLDLACGLNPAYLHRRYPQIRVIGADVSGQCVRILRLLGVEALHADLLSGVPKLRADAALLFKILPLLERQKSGAALQLLSEIDARFIVVSFPTRTLSGRSVGMASHYAEWMEAHLPQNRRIAESFATGNELYYLLEEN